ncbi:MAG: hypothetical protein R3B54_00070 [Bdellovibrionota bacterium]
MARSESVPTIAIEAVIQGLNADLPTFCQIRAWTLVPDTHDLLRTATSAGGKVNRAELDRAHSLFDWRNL